MIHGPSLPLQRRSHAIRRSTSYRDCGSSHKVFPYYHALARGCGPWGRAGRRHPSPLMSELWHDTRIEGRAGARSPESAHLRRHRMARSDKPFKSETLLCVSVLGRGTAVRTPQMLMGRPDSLGTASLDSDRFLVSGICVGLSVFHMRLDRPSCCARPRSTLDERVGASPPHPRSLVPQGRRPRCGHSAGAARGACKASATCTPRPHRWSSHVAVGRR